MHRHILFFTALVGLTPLLLHADPQDSAYLRALRIAEKKVARMKVNSANPYPTYTVGQTWQVAAISWSTTSAFHSPSYSDPREVQGRVSLFHYEVVEAQAQSPFLTKIRITSTLDPRLESLELQFHAADSPSKNLQIKKTYRFKSEGSKVKSVSASVDGLHSAISPLELFPLDFPDLRSAETKKLKKSPPIPQNLTASAKSLHQKVRSPFLQDAHYYEQDDFFGRPIQVLWESELPWPSYYRTANGVAVLVTSEDT